MISDMPSLAHLRLANQQIAAPSARTPAEVVAALGAMQAQDYGGSLWAIGLRLPASTESDIERAVAERTIVRTWPMRGTLHFVAPADARWMLELLTPRVLEATRKRHAELELDDTLFRRIRKILGRALADGRYLTRDATFDLLAREGVETDAPRRYHIPFRLAQEGFLCFGPREGRQPTFALLEEWTPNARRLDREEALAELALRYFTSHGPATVKDFAWWSGLRAADARAGLEAVASQLAHETVSSATFWMVSGAMLEPAPSAHLLPGFDEYLLGYTDRGAVLDPRHAPKIIPGNNGVFMPTLVLDGQVVGTWKRAARKKAFTITLQPFARATKTLISARSNLPRSASVRSTVCGGNRYRRVTTTRVGVVETPVAEVGQITSTFRPGCRPFAAIFQAVRPVRAAHLAILAEAPEDGPRVVGGNAAHDGGLVCAYRPGQVFHTASTAPLARYLSRPSTPLRKKTPRLSPLVARSIQFTPSGDIHDSPEKVGSSRNARVCLSMAMGWWKRAPKSTTT